MADFLSEWAAADLTEVTLPSGRQVRLRLPEPRDLIVRGILPSTLIQAVMAEPSTTFDNIGEENPELYEELVSSMKILAADAIRQGRRTPDDEWEAIVVPVSTYVLLPEPDRELIESMVVGRLPDAGADAGTPAKERAAREEAAATVAGFREFRDEPSRPARRPRRSALEHTAVDDDSRAPADPGAGSRRRTRRAPDAG